MQVWKECVKFNVYQKFLSMVIINSFYFAVFFIIQVIVMFYYLYIIVLNIFIQGDVDTKLNKELGADPGVVWNGALWLE